MMHGQNNPSEVYNTASLSGERYVKPETTTNAAASNQYGSVHQQTTTTTVNQQSGLITSSLAPTNDLYQQRMVPTTTTSYVREVVAPSGMEQQQSQFAEYATANARSAVQNLGQGSAMSYVKEAVTTTAPQIQTHVTSTTQGGEVIGHQQQQLGHQQLGHQQQMTSTSAQYQQQEYTQGSHMQTTQSSTAQHEEHTRKISSVVVESTPLMEVPEDTVRYVTVPVYVDEVEYKTTKETRYIPGPAQKPEIRYVDKPVPVVKVVEEVVEVPIPNKLGPIVDEVTMPNPNRPEPVVDIVYRDVPVTNYVDHEVPVIVAQMTKPMIREHGEQIEVAARDFQPEIVHVDVHLVRPVENTLQLIDKVRSSHKLVDIGAAQYNTLLRSLNAGSQCELPYVAIGGRIDYVPESEVKYTIAPANIKIEGWSPKTPNPAAAAAQFNSSATGAQYGASATGAQYGSSATGAQYGAYQITGSAESSFVGQTQQATEVLTREVRHLGAPRAQNAASGDRRSRTSSAYSGAVNAVGSHQQVSSKAREVVETKENGGEESRSSSVSSSINKIASQLQQRGPKRNYMCCGTTGGASRNSRSRGSQIETVTNTLNQYSYPGTATTSGQEGLIEHSARSHHSRNTGTAPHSSIYPAGDGTTTSHHISVGGHHSSAAGGRPTRVC